MVDVDNLVNSTVGLAEVGIVAGMTERIVNGPRSRRKGHRVHHELFGR